MYFSFFKKNEFGSKQLKVLFKSTLTEEPVKTLSFKKKTFKKCEHFYKSHFYSTQFFMKFIKLIKEIKCGKIQENIYHKKDKH